MSTPFEAWRARVDIQLMKLVGATSDGLPDYDYMDAYLAGETPHEVALEVIENCKEW